MKNQKVRNTTNGLNQRESEKMFCFQHPIHKDIFQTRKMVDKTNDHHLQPDTKVSS